MFAQREVLLVRLVDNQQAKDIALMMSHNSFNFKLTCVLNVIVGTFCIEELHTLKASRRHILHVLGPSNTLRFE